MHLIKVYGALLRSINVVRYILHVYFWFMKVSITGRKSQRGETKNYLITFVSHFSMSLGVMALCNARIIILDRLISTYRIIIRFFAVLCINLHHRDHSSSNSQRIPWVKPWKNLKFSSSLRQEPINLLSGL